METSSAAEIQPQQWQEVPRDERRANAREMALFYVVGLGTSLGATAVLSCLVFYTAALGLDSFVYLHLAAFAPMLPLTVLQARYDTAMDRRFGRSRTVYEFRGCVGFAVIVAALCALPFASDDLAASCAVTTVLGTATSVLFGSLQQMASFVYKNCGRLPAALSAGFQSSALLILVVSLSTGFGSSGSSAGVYSFYFAIAALVLISWACFHVLMQYSRDVAESMSGRDYSLEAAPDGDLVSTQMKEEQEGRAVMGRADPQTETPPALSIQRDPHTGKDTLMKRGGDVGTDREDLTYRHLWSKSWASCAALIVTVVSSIMIASWLNRVQSARDDNPSFPQVLFYTRNLGDILGRPFTLLAGGHADNARFLRRVGIIATVQAVVCVPLFYVYVSAPTDLLPRNDAAVVLFVGLFAFLAGALKTLIYQRAPYLLMDHPKSGAVQTEQTNLLNICFSVALLLGIFINLGLQELEKI